MTVSGPVKPLELGTTLIHEHILVDFIGADSIGYERWDRKDVIDKILPYLAEIKERGVKTFIDCAPVYLGRDPFLLKELSARSGLHIITNTGYYGAGNNKFLPENFFSSDVSEIAGKWIDEFKNGIEGSSVKPGFIKIAVNEVNTLSADHKKIISSAAITHLETGLTIVSHTGTDIPAFEQLDILKNTGVDPSAFVWTHAQSGTIEGNIKAASMGAWISLDNILNREDLEPGTPYSIQWYADRIIALKNKGFLNKVLISHDSGWYDPAKPQGGTINGYTDIFDYFLPVLLEKGLTRQDIDSLLINNPQEAFLIKVRSLR
ncbi:MAG: hypothetical protein U2P89_10085 [Proteiniphilum sp.]|uniref:phosphotriesterase family protein n=1 Tax=Proteiniphilum sp. TaxID=1926877 RepID=UPI002ABC901D|nr:hypothetical protein [Proteiniphilum sp.]MDY9919204.1 hypothetical protein [Proteiniphilum sp.]